MNIWYNSITDERVRFARELSAKYGIQSRFIAIFDNNRSIALMNSNEHLKQGFVIDMTCDGIETIFAQVRPLLVQHLNTVEYIL